MRIHVSLGFFMGFVLVLSGMVPIADAQTPTENVLAIVHGCDFGSVGAALVKVGSHTIQTDAQGYGSVDIPPGSYQATATVLQQPALPLAHAMYTEGSIRSESMDADASGNVRFTVTSYGGGTLSLHMCATKLVRVRIATTTSCTDNPNDRTLQGGITGARCKFR